MNLSDPSGDCLVIIRTREPALVGKRFQLDHSPTIIGRSPTNHIVLEGDTVSRRHARLEKREDSWVVLDDGSTVGTHHNDQPLVGEAALSSGDRVKTGSTIFKFLSGADIEEQYRAEIERLNIVDGLTGIHHEEYFLAALDREILSSRRHDRELALVLFSITEYSGLGRKPGPDERAMLRILADMMTPHHDLGEVFARLDDDIFALLLPQHPRSEVKKRAEALQEHVMAYPHEARPGFYPRRFYTLFLQDTDPGAEEFIKRARNKMIPLGRWYQGADKDLI